MSIDCEALAIKIDELEDQVEDLKEELQKKDMAQHLKRCLIAKILTIPGDDAGVAKAEQLLSELEG
jgi:hypothetical protein